MFGRSLVGVGGVGRSGIGGSGRGETNHLAGFKEGGDSDHVQHGLQDGGAPHRFEHEAQVGHF